MRVISDLVPSGTIYLTQEGTLLSAGVPSLQSNYYYSIPAGHKLGAITNMFIVPKPTGQIKPNYVTFSISNNSNAPSIVEFQMKQPSFATWTTEFNFPVGDSYSTQFYWPLDGVPTIPNTTTGYDARLVVRKTSSNGTMDASCSLSLRMTEWSKIDFFFSYKYFVFGSQHNEVSNQTWR